MTLAKREQVLVAVEAALAAISAVPGLSVERNRTDPIEAFPTLVLFDGDHQVDREVMTEDRTTLTFEIEIHARAAPAENIGSVVNVIYAEIKQALGADVTLGGLVEDMREREFSRPQLDVTDVSQTQAAGSVTFEVEFWTPRNSPF